MESTFATTSQSRSTMLASRSEWSEAALLQGLLGRRGDAWSEFQRRFDRRLWAAIQGVIERTGLTRADGEEIRATLLCSLVAHDMHRLRAFEAARGVRLGTWLVMLAKNAAWDYVRRETRTARRTVSDDACETVSDEDDPLQVLVAKEGWLRLLDALAHLSTRDRCFVELVFFEGCPVEQVASHLHVSVHTVYNKKITLRRRLTASLDHGANT